jgi:hypothetical protein
MGASAYRYHGACGMPSLADGESNKAHSPFLHFELRHIRDVAHRSGKAVTFMPGLEVTRNAAVEQGATAVQCRRECPLAEHRTVFAELRASSPRPRQRFVAFVGERT